MTGNISDKDKKDWQTFLSSDEKLQNKDKNFQKKTYIKNQGYNRVFELNIFNLKENKDTSHIYQGKIVSKGQCGEMQEVAPHLIKMMFKKYGWKLGLAIFMYYLIRDVTLYIVIPYLIYRGFIG